MPTQAQADAWAHDKTNGQIQSMPAAVNNLTRLLLATAVAMEARWYEAFDLVPAADLGVPWASRVNRVMRRYAEDRVRVVAHTEAVGFVAVSRESGRGGLDVISVIAEPEVLPARVIAAAYDVAASFASLPSTAAFVPAFDLPLTGHAWVVRERVLENYVGDDRIEKSEVTIPAWTATTRLDDLIAAPGTGFPEIARSILRQLVPAPGGDTANAAQSATARFDTNGFSAAALTVLEVLGAARPSPPQRTIERTVEVRFDHPFAVVAATNTDSFSRPEGTLLCGLPAFGAWVTVAAAKPGHFARPSRRLGFRIPPPPPLVAASPSIRVRVHQVDRDHVDRPPAEL